MGKLILILIQFFLSFKKFFELCRALLYILLFDWVMWLKYLGERRMGDIHNDIKNFVLQFFKNLEAVLSSIIYTVYGEEKGAYVLAEVVQYFKNLRAILIKYFLPRSILELFEILAQLVIAYYLFSLVHDYYAVQYELLWGPKYGSLLFKQHDRMMKCVCVYLVHKMIRFGVPK
jgi:hypothetical protein